jgi:3-dehydroquinate synthase II
MKRVWVKAVPWDREIALAAMECGADALWAPPGWVSEVRKMGIIPIVAEDGDLKPGQDVIEKEVRDKRDEEEIVTLSISKTVVVKGVDRTIIPLENLLSKMDHLFVEMENLHEGRTAFDILERGVEGVVINNPDPDAVHPSHA